MADLKTIKGVIFDLDGTLLDSMWMWESVEEDYLKKQGLTPHPNQVEALRSLSLYQVARYFQIEYGIRKSVTQITDEKNEMIADFYSQRAQMKDGIIPVLEALRDRGIKMCIATATDRHLMEPALRRCGIYAYFERIFTCGEEETSKSSPDIYIRAAKYLGTDISETLVVEDALYAVKSAKRAGFPVAAVYDRSADDQQKDIRGLCDYYWHFMDEMLELL